MKSLILILSVISLSSVSAKTITCATQLSSVKAGDPQRPKICGAVKVNADNDGLKRRRIPRFCKNIRVDFFSVKPGDEARFTNTCDKIRTPGCYVVKVHNTQSHQGLSGLYAEFVVPSVGYLPVSFNLSASAVGKKTGINIGAGKHVHLDMKCSVLP